MSVQATRRWPRPLMSALTAVGSKRMLAGGPRRDESMSYAKVLL
jgi:hypothetical protein